MIIKRRERIIDFTTMWTRFVFFFSNAPLLLQTFSGGVKSSWDQFEQHVYSMGNSHEQYLLQSVYFTEFLCRSIFNKSIAKNYPQNVKKIIIFLTFVFQKKKKKTMHTLPFLSNIVWKSRTEFRRVSCSILFLWKWCQVCLDLLGQLFIFTFFVSK